MCEVLLMDRRTFQEEKMLHILCLVWRGDRTVNKRAGVALHIEGNTSYQVESFGLPLFYMLPCFPCFL